MCAAASRLPWQKRGRFWATSSRDHTRAASRSAHRGRGYLEDGLLDRLELEDAIQSTAVPAETTPPDPQDPYAIPALPAAHFARGGHGIVDDRSMRRALQVVVGRIPRPDRPLEDAWISFTDALRDALWS